MAGLTAMGIALILAMFLWAVMFGMAYFGVAPVLIGIALAGIGSAGAFKFRGCNRAPPVGRGADLGGAECGADRCDPGADRSSFAEPLTADRTSPVFSNRLAV